MQSLDDLLQPVTEATSAGDLNWEQDEVGFAAALGEYRIVTWQWEDEHDGSSGVSIGLKKQGLMSPALDSIIANEYSPRYERLSEFYRLARRSALNVDEIVTSLKRDLKALRTR